jgi:hypothetical protein
MPSFLWELDDWIQLTSAPSLQMSATLQSFVLAMVLYPETQRRAQEEIDTVLGHGHLPHFRDADALPYLKAMLTSCCGGLVRIL